MDGMFLNGSEMIKQVFYLALVLLPFTAWRRQKMVGKVYGLLILLVIL